MKVLRAASASGRLQTVIRRPLALALAALAAAPLVGANGFGLTDIVQNDPGTAGTASGDAGDDPASATFLQPYHGGRTTGWLRGAVIPEDDPVDAYQLAMEPTSKLTVTVVPEHELDVSLVLYALKAGEWIPADRVDEQGPGGAEILRAEPGGAPYVFAVVTKLATSAEDPIPRPGFAVPFSSLDLQTYSLRGDCDPFC